VIPTRRIVVVLALVPGVLAVGACGGFGGAAERATTDAADRTAIATWSEPAGIAPDLVYLTEIDGFDLATQSVGVMGDDGMSAIYLKHAGKGVGTVMLTTARDPGASVVSCAELPDSTQTPVRCSVERGDAHVVLEGQDVEPSTVRAAAEAVRVPTADELGDLFADLPQMPDTPVERGDLPPGGDGAPLDPPAAGG
jgi:hypothetical protein